MQRPESMMRSGTATTTRTAPRPIQTTALARGSLRSSSQASLQRKSSSPMSSSPLAGSPLAASNDNDDESIDEVISESDVVLVKRLLSSASNTEDKARLTSLIGRLESGEEGVRQGAQRELHAMRALGLHGSGATRSNLKDSGRTNSDSRIGRSYMPDGASASAGNLNNNNNSNSNNNNNVPSSDASAPALLRAGEDDKPKKRLSFWQRKRVGSSAVPMARGVASVPSEMDDSWEMACDALAGIEWADAFASTEQNGLLEVKTKKFSVGLGGALCAGLTDGLVLEDWESYRFLYEEVFVGRPHALYLGRGPKGPVVVVVESMGPVERKSDRARFRVLALDKNGYHKSVISSSTNTRERLRLIKRGPLTATLEGVNLRKPEKQQQLGTQLLIFEKKRVVHHAKFGLLYRKAGQVEENDIYSNEHGSPQFVHFLGHISTIVPLKGHVGFRGGLDVKEDLTGTSSGFTRLLFDKAGTPLAPDAAGAALSVEVMLHVAPLLPYDPVNPQQLHRKRHVGNDVVVVVFCEGDDPFNPEVLTSNYNHVFLLVRPVPDDPSGRRRPTHYRVCHASVRGVKPFRPFVPENGLIPAEHIRAWLLTKVLNAERAAMYAPEFSQKLSRTITTVVGSWVDEF